GIALPYFSADRVEIAEQERLALGAVERVGFVHRMRMDFELALAVPVHFAPERLLEMAHRLVDDRVDHLLMKSRIGFARLEAAAEENRRLVEIDGLVVALVADVVIDDGDARADRARLERLIRDA